MLLKQLFGCNFAFRKRFVMICAEYRFILVNVQMTGIESTDTFMIPYIFSETF